MSLTTVAAPPASFADNLGLVTMPADCQGYFLLGTDQASSVVDQMGGAPLTITGPVNYGQGFADFRGGAYATFPAASSSRDRTTLIVSSSSGAEQVLENGNFVWPPTTPGELRYVNGQYLLEWNGGANFMACSSGAVVRTESGDLAADYLHPSNNTIAYPDLTFTPNFWGGGVITSGTGTTVFSPYGQGVYVMTQAFSGAPAAASATVFGNRGGPASSHAFVAAIAQFPALTADQAMLRLNKMLTDVSRRLGYRVKRGGLDMAA